MTAVDPRTILANALTYLRTSPDWCKTGNTWVQLGGCRIALDPQGIDLISYRATTGEPLVGFQPPADPWADPDAWPADWSRSAAEAVDVLCAKGILPHRLSTGYQLASHHWAKQVTEAREAAAKAQEAKALADQDVRDLAEQLATLDANIAEQMRADAATVRDLRRQLDEVTAGAGRGVKAVAA